MLLEETLNIFMRHMIDDILEVPGFAVRTQEPDAPRPLANGPNGSYATVGFFEDALIGTPDRTHEETIVTPPYTDLIETVETLSEITFSLNFYRGDAYDNARTVRNAMASATNLASLTAAKLSLLSRSAVRNISTAFESGWEQRAQMDITLYTLNTSADTINGINCLRIDGVVHQRSNQNTITIEDTEL